MHQGLYRLGSSTLSLVRSGGEFLRFCRDCLLALLRADARNSATWDTILRQIYFTAFQILPVIILYTVASTWVITLIIDSVTRAYNLVAYEATLAVRFLAMELLPFLTAVLITLRSGAAINTEIALMRVNNELDTLRHFGVDPLYTEFMPRLISGVVSVTALSVLSSLISIAVEFFILNGTRISNLSGFSRSLVDAVELHALFWWLLKCLLFGLCVSLIPMHFGLKTAKRMAAVPISVMRGMVRAFFGIMMIEVGILALTYM